MEFEILKQSKKSRARIGKIKTSHGELITPAFLPVATQGIVKTLSSEEIKEIGYQAILANTFHLYLSPGSSLIKKFGGLHKFMNFDGIIFTDSGGFQVFSLGKGIEQGVGKVAKIFPEKEKPKPRGSSLVKIRKEGVVFKSPFDGKEHFFTPEKSIKIQEDLGGDIIFAFDECTSPLDDFDYTKRALERTHFWAERCKKAKKRKDQALFGIVQGGEWKQLRIESAKFISSLDFSGFGIGGSLGKTKKKMYQILDWTIPFLPNNKPRHLLGIGYLEDFEESIKKGIDLFDCSYPTRMARHGIVFTKKGILDLSKKKFLKEKSPIERSCQCFVCQNYSRGYLSHLFRAKEISALRFFTYHNLWFYYQFLEKIREKIYYGKI